MSVVGWVAKLWHAVLATVFPPRCALCGSIEQPPICEVCRAEMTPHEAPVSMPSKPHPLSIIVSLYPFEGRAAQAVKRLKYSRATSLGAPMAAAIRSMYDQFDLAEFDIVVPVPISKKRRRERGFNQSDFLCEGLPKDSLATTSLLRIRHTRPQASLTARQRLENLTGAFEADKSVRGKSVLLVDDVVTTGGTGIACAEALLAGGATKIGLLTYCGESNPDYRSGDSKP